MLDNLEAGENRKSGVNATHSRVLLTPPNYCGMQGNAKVVSHKDLSCVAGIR